MFRTTDINFDNVKPSKKTFASKKINFRDKNDLIENAIKEKNVYFSKKSNLFFFLLTISFICFISFNLIKISATSKNNHIYNERKIIKVRGKIVDKKNEIIATSLETKDLYVNLKKSLDKTHLKENLMNIFDKKEALFFEKVFKKKYSLIQKDVSLSDLNKLKMLGDPSIQLHKSSKRVYPQHNIFSHIAGIKTSEIKSKLERHLDHSLSEGENIKLTVDLRVQNIVREELFIALKKYEALSALAIVMNVNNGEILSMVSLPDFDPNYPQSIQPNTESNLATEARYEMGSTLKIFNAAIAYETKPEILEQKFDISNGYQITKEKKITDKYIKNKNLSFDEVFIKSSNVGSVKILESIGNNSQKNFFDLVGLTSNLTIEGLNIVSNKLPNNWSAHSKFISYGYGISISPISLITAFSSLVNGGYKINPVLVKPSNYDKQNKSEKILSPKTSKRINELIKKIVNEGTGKLAFVEGISVGGKTGTSKKVEMGNYSEDKVVTSFVGVFPVNKPEYLTFVLFDEPKTNINNTQENTGGNTAAPIFSKIVKKISPIISENNFSKVFKK